MKPIKLKVNDPWSLYQDVTAAWLPFVTPTGNLWGETYVSRNAPSATGKLPEEWDVLWDDERGHIRYAVWSYQTPIMWVATDPGGGYYVLPDVRYSRTTTRHQNKIRAALAQQRVVITKAEEHPLHNAPLSLPVRDIATVDMPHCGEGAIYSPEYLASRLAPGDRARSNLAQRELAFRATSANNHRAAGRAHTITHC